MEENGNGGSSTTTTTTDVDTAKAERSVWLLKCPSIVSKSLQSSSSSTASDSPPVAKIVVSLDPLIDSGEPSSLQMTMEMIGNEFKNAPKNYSLNMYKDLLPMCVFSEKTQNNKLGIEGKIEHKFDMKPQNTNRNLEEYSKLCRERTNKSMIKTRQIQVIENHRGIMQQLSRPPPPSIPVMANAMDYNKKKKGSSSADLNLKRFRRDRGEVENMIFKLFERKVNWNFKNLVQETDQPPLFLKEIINELCFYNKRGANQGTYELKPQYKNNNSMSVAD